MKRLPLIILLLLAALLSPIKTPSSVAALTDGVAAADNLTWPQNHGLPANYDCLEPEEPVFEAETLKELILTGLKGSHSERDGCSGAIGCGKKSGGAPGFFQAEKNPLAIPPSHSHAAVRRDTHRSRTFPLHNDYLSTPDHLPPTHI